MARYRLTAPTFINGALRPAGEEVEYAGTPGSTLAAVEISHVPIPDDWRRLNGLQRIALARALGAPKSRISAAEADTWIGTELDRRAGKLDAAKDVDVGEALVTLEGLHRQIAGAQAELDRLNDEILDRKTAPGREGAGAAHG
jgi:hypothetical protein